MVTKLEQSQFDHPPPEILRKLSSIYGVSESILLIEWKNYVSATRRDFAARYPKFGEVLRNYEGLRHPLVFYREQQGLSRYALCRELCLHYDPVTDYENNKQRAVPMGIINACGNMYWDYAPLDEAVTLWRQSGRADELKRKRAQTSSIL